MMIGDPSFIINQTKQHETTRNNTAYRLQWPVGMPHFLARSTEQATNKHNSVSVKFAALSIAHLNASDLPVWELTAGTLPGTAKINNSIVFSADWHVTNCETPLPTKSITMHLVLHIILSCVAFQFTCANTLVGLMCHHTYMYSSSDIHSFSK